MPKCRWPRAGHEAGRRAAPRAAWDRVGAHRRWTACLALLVVGAAGCSIWVRSEQTKAADATADLRTLRAALADVDDPAM